MRSEPKGIGWVSNTAIMRASCLVSLYTSDPSLGEGEKGVPVGQCGENLAEASQEPPGRRQSISFPLDLKAQCGLGTRGLGHLLLEGLCSGGAMSLLVPLSRTSLPNTSSQLLSCPRNGGNFHTPAEGRGTIKVLRAPGLLEPINFPRNIYP